MTRHDEGAERALIEVRGVTKDFAKAGSLLRRGETISALSEVDLDVRSGEWLGLVGESGSGKTTLARIIAGLETATSGTVTVAGDDVAKQSGADRRAFARRVQFVYQDSIGALNPRWTALELVAEPLRIHGSSGRKAVPTQTLVDLLADVGLDPSIGSKRPGQLSGGQCQRINLARALALDPDILLLDEPTSALDVSVQSQIIALLREVQKARGLSVVLISHDLALVSQTCQRLAVMYLGTIVETGSTADIVASPQHPYTAQLLDAVPRLGDDVAPHAPPARDATEPPDPSAPPSGCRYHTRCAKADALCADVRPDLEWDARSTRAFACHHPLSDTAPRGDV